MKLKSMLLTVLAMASLTSLSNAVTVFVVSNDTVTIEGAGTPAGRLLFVSTTADISGTAAGIFNPLLTGPTTSAEFDTAVATWIGAETPGIFLPETFTAGATSLVGTAADAGTAANNTYVLIVAESGGNVDGFGIYTGPPVPGVDGAYFANAVDVGDGIGIGTSTSGFSLAAVNPIPEPSVALLGALGVIGLLRRRR